MYVFNNNNEVQSRCHAYNIIGKNATNPYQFAISAYLIMV